MRDAGARGESSATEATTVTERAKHQVSTLRGTTGRGNLQPPEAGRYLDDMSTIPQRLRQARLEASRSAQSIADAIGVSQSTISAVELGTREPKLVDLAAWAEELGLRLDLVPISGPALPARRQVVLDLMAEVLHLASEEDVDVWEAELRIRRRHLRGPKEKSSTP